MKQFGPDYSMKAPPDLLMTKHGESHPTERADLWGKRAVFCIETEAGRHMAEALVKELTGGDRVRARRMREDFWEFVPTHHVWLSSNYKPVVTGTDYGIWRRIKLIPFDVVIPDSEQDKKLPAKLEAELPGVLDWAIAGCLDWQRNGMQEPSVVRDATKEYSEEMDDVGQFIEAQCDRAPEYMTPATVLYQSFVESTGSKISQKRFGSELKRRGFRNGRITAGVHKAKMGWFGLRLAPAEATKEGLEKLKDSVKKRKGGK
jgi:putative DNA primase/helicase